MTIPIANTAPYIDSFQDFFLIEANIESIVSIGTVMDFEGDSVFVTEVLVINAEFTDALEVPESGTD